MKDLQQHLNTFEKTINTELNRNIGGPPIYKTLSLSLNIKKKVGSKPNDRYQKSKISLMTESINSRIINEDI